MASVNKEWSKTGVQSGQEETPALGDGGSGVSVGLFKFYFPSSHAVFELSFVYFAIIFRTIFFDLFFKIFGCHSYWHIFGASRRFSRTTSKCFTILERDEGVKDTLIKY